MNNSNNNALSSIAIFLVGTLFGIILILLSIDTLIEVDGVYVNGLSGKAYTAEPENPMDYSSCIDIPSCHPTQVKITNYKDFMTEVLSK